MLSIMTAGAQIELLIHPARQVESFTPIALCVLKWLIANPGSRCYKNLFYQEISCFLVKSSESKASLLCSLILEKPFAFTAYRFSVFEP